VIVEFSAADDVRSGMERAVQLLRRAGGVDRVEWWSAGAGEPQLEAADGDGGGRRASVQIGSAGTLVVEGDWLTGPVAATLVRLAPILRRRSIEERLALRAGMIARQNAALEDFASLVAHELKAPLHAALLGADATAAVRSALELVDTLLEAAHGDRAGESSARTPECLADVSLDLDPIPARVVADLHDEFPLAPAELRLVLRNLITNALAAGATRISVRTIAAPGSSALVVEDDGVGLEASAAGAYASGNGLGLGLCRRIVGRRGGTLELLPRRPRGATAQVVIPRGEQ
jgi:signal transduction histidine kinase